MTIFFTADHHFGHDNIRGFAKRPWNSVQEMDVDLIRRWNEVVTPKDTVMVLGDHVFHGTAQRIFEVNHYLNGQKHLLMGNHDPKFLRTNHCGFVSVQDVANLVIEGEAVFLSHYAHRAWPGSFHGSYHFYGHTHAVMPPIHRSLDVGVDCWDYRPVTFAQIRERLDQLGLNERGKEKFEPGMQLTLNTQETANDDGARSGAEVSAAE